MIQIEELIPGQQKYTRILRLGISLLQCPKLREKLIKEFICSNPNIHNMTDLHAQIGCFTPKTLYKWRNKIRNPSQGQPMVLAYAPGMASNISHRATPSCVLSLESATLGSNRSLTSSQATARAMLVCGPR